MKTILVTGATRGIGRAITDNLLAEGHSVYDVYNESVEQANELTAAHGNLVVSKWLVYSCSLTTTTARR